MHKLMLTMVRQVVSDLLLQQTAFRLGLGKSLHDSSGSDRNAKTVHVLVHG
jgi:hypothetical protein